MVPHRDTLALVAVIMVITTVGAGSTLVRADTTFILRSIYIYLHTRTNWTVAPPSGSSMYGLTTCS